MFRILSHRRGVKTPEPLFTPEVLLVAWSFSQVCSRGCSQSNEPLPKISRVVVRESVREKPAKSLKEELVSMIHALMGEIEGSMWLEIPLGCST